MTCIYNEEIFEKFRTFAVTDPAKIEIGKTYFSNVFPYEFTVNGLYKEYEGSEAGDHWFSYKDEDGVERHGRHSLQDRNCGASWNPWMIFTSKMCADQCMKELEVHIESDYPFASDYDYDDVHDLYEEDGYDDE